MNTMKNIVSIAIAVVLFIIPVVVVCNISKLAGIITFTQAIVFIMITFILSYGCLSLYLRYVLFKDEFEDED